MDKYGRTSTRWLALLFIFLSLRTLSVIGDGGQRIAQNMQEKPPFAKMVIDTLSKLRTSHKSSLHKIKTIIRDIQLQFSPPNLDFNGADQEMKSRVAEGGGGTGERMKAAAEKSFEVSKMTAEESAKSAAKVVGETMHKVKDKLSQDDDNDEEKQSPHHEEL